MRALLRVSCVQRHGVDGAQDQIVRVTATGDLRDLTGFLSDVIPVAKLLAPVLARCLQASQQEQPYPDGVTFWDDWIRIHAPLDMGNEAALLASLYARPPTPADVISVCEVLLPVSISEGDTTQAASTWELLSNPNSDFWRPFLASSRLTSLDVSTQSSLHLLPLPTALRPPPGLCHGDPRDPAGNAAREAYARQIAPWFSLVRRMFQFGLAMDGRQMGSELRACGVEEAGLGRWATLLAHAGSGYTAKSRFHRFVVSNKVSKQCIHHAMVGLVRAFSGATYSVAVEMFRKHKPLNALSSQVEDEMDALTPPDKRPPSALARLGTTLAGAPAALTAAVTSVRKLLRTAAAAQQGEGGAAPEASAGGSGSGKAVGGEARDTGAAAGTGAAAASGKGPQAAVLPWWERVRAAVLGPADKSG